MNLESILILCLFSEIVVRGDVNEFIYLSGIHYEMCLYILYIYIYIHKSIALFYIVYNTLYIIIQYFIQYIEFNYKMSIFIIISS